MCGIVGYIGPRKAVPILIESMEKLSTVVTTLPGWLSPVGIHCLS